MVPTATVILMLETDEATRELYRRELGRVYRVVACATERDAMVALQAENVRAIVLEPVALRDDNWGFVAAVRAMPQHVHTPIVVCSTLDERRRGSELGVVAYLIKPVMPQTLVTTLAAVMQLSAAHESTS